MKKTICILSFLFVLLSGCAPKEPAAPISAGRPEQMETAQDVKRYLQNKNAEYVSAKQNGADVSSAVRKDTAENGQHPYAVVVTCSDSRVPPEHIFGAGIGELFVIRTAGNVIGDYELGSVEYGAEHLGAKLVLVLGHTSCGAVDAALSGDAHGNIKTITDEILSCLPENCDARQAERINVQNSMDIIRNSEIMQGLIAEGVEVKGAIYDISTGAVDFMD